MILLLALFLGTTRLAGAQDDGRAGGEFFENRIRPVLVEHCLKCHGAQKSKGRLRLDAREFVLRGGESGPAVVVGEPEQSRLMQAIRGTHKDLKMPKDEPPLASAQIQDFATWIKIGLPYPAATIATQGGKMPADLTAARRFWSFQPLKNSPPPGAAKATSPSETIDQFIRAKFAAKGLSPAPAADKRALLRRATYDLTGLPPTPEELDAFLADTSRDAFARAVDRLLASPQYGVHWARHWLDVARYGDTRWVGAGEDRRWPFAYTYRDWVVRALNEDLPYDRFVSLQLAADQMPGARAADQAALGFLTVGRWFTGTLPDVIDDQIDVVTRGLLGLTAQCARCHDHKYDPISTKDYYSLYGLFAASRMPVDGTGVLASLPEIEPRPVSDAVEKELAAQRAQIDEFLVARQKSVREEFRAPNKMLEYLLAAASISAKKDDAARALAKEKKLNEFILLRWLRVLQRTAKNPHPIFAAFHAFAELPAAEFNAKAAGIAEIEAKRAKANRHVVALLTPPPGSLADLAERYVRLFAKFDVPDKLSEFEEDSVRQVLRGGDSPVQIQLPEVGQFLTDDEKQRVAQQRRALLAKLAALPERADQFLGFQTEATPVVTEIRDFLAKRSAAVAAEIRSPEKIAEYLLAAHEAAGADDVQLKAVVKSRKLSDRLLRRWVEFLAGRARENDAVFAAWRAFAAIPAKDFTAQAGAVAARVAEAKRNSLVTELFSKAPATLAEVAKRYGEVIAESNSPTPAGEREREALRQVCVARESPLGFQADEVFDYFTRKDTDELVNLERKLARLYLESPGAGPRALALRESPRGYAQKVFVRGNANVPGEDAHGRFLSVLARADAPAFHAGQGRRELAEAIVDPANPLTARVLVNRVWQWHFGAGLVSTPSDFGTRGTEPSHPELLDALARQFLADGGSLKQLHRHILLSATYQQSSDDNAKGRAIDPDNRLLWHFSRRRLSFEELRDSLLTAAGRLDVSAGGRPVDLTQGSARRRTLYGTVDRITLPGFYRYFDFPSADAHVSERHETIIPQQALYLMNNAFVLEQATALARRTETALNSTPSERIVGLFRAAYGRRPGAEELALGLEFVASRASVLAAPPSAAAEMVAAVSDDAWSYGSGRYDEKAGRVVAFAPLPFFANNQWRGGPQEIDPALGRLTLHARGGNAGRDGSLASIRRWTAPRDGTFSISGTLAVQQGAIVPSGDGVRGRIVSSRHGQLGVWIAHGTEEPTEIAGVEVRHGDTIDFVTDARGREQQAAGYTWSPVLRLPGADAVEKKSDKKDKAADAKKEKLLWDAAKEFKGAPPPPQPFGIWERYAQALLEGNEFMFID